MGSLIQFSIPSGDECGLSVQSSGLTDCFPATSPSILAAIAKASILEAAQSEVGLEFEHGRVRD
jgi:hypothetical protein